jgi:hypothetical protein
MRSLKSIAVEIDRKERAALGLGPRKTRLYQPIGNRSLPTVTEQAKALAAEINIDRKSRRLAAIARIAKGMK